jgi:hypothetical protein
LDLLLLYGLLVFLILHLLLELLALNFFVSSHIGIEDLPLGRLKRKVRALRGVSLDTLLAERQVEGLRGALLVVELVTE